MYSLSVWIWNIPAGLTPPCWAAACAQSRGWSLWPAPEGELIEALGWMLWVSGEEDGALLWLAGHCCPMKLKNKQQAPEEKCILSLPHPVLINLTLLLLHLSYLPVSPSLGYIFSPGQYLLSWHLFARRRITDWARRCSVKCIALSPRMKYTLSGSSLASKCCCGSSPLFLNQSKSPSLQATPRRVAAFKRATEQLQTPGSLPFLY